MIKRAVFLNNGEDGMELLHALVAFVRQDDVH